MTIREFSEYQFRDTGSFQKDSFSSTLLSEIQTKRNAIPYGDLDIGGYSSQYIDVSHRHIIVNTNKSRFARININWTSGSEVF